MPKQPAAIAGFTVVSPPDEVEWSWPVYRGGSGPAVVILHELYGLSKDDIAFAVRIRDAGFTVWLPVLIGPAPAKTRWDAAQAVAGFCISREIVKLRTGRTSPVVTPLRALARHALAQSGGTGVGIIGMCMSGGFALGTAVDDAVLAAVAAEPALPFASPITPWCAKDPGVSTDDLATIRTRLTRGDVEVFLTRFTSDRMSPATRFAALESALGSTGVKTDPIPSGPGSAPAFPKKSHAVLSTVPAHYNGGTPQRDRLDVTFRDVVDLLRRRLGHKDSPGNFVGLPSSVP